MKKRQKNKKNSQNPMKKKETQILEWLIINKMRFNNK